MSLGRILMSWEGTQPNCQTFSIFSDNPLISFRHSKNILETLVRRSLPLDSSSEMVRSLDGCLDVKLVSSYIPLLPFRHINLNNTKHLHFTGTSFHLIYSISCSKCGMLHIRETGRLLMIRFGERRRVVIREFKIYDAAGSTTRLRKK